MNKITVLVTVGGQGTRMKCISPLPKHMLYYGGKRIIDQIIECFPGLDVQVFDGYHEGGRKYALESLRGMKNVLVCDCDIIPVGIMDYGSLFIELGALDDDAIWYFESDCTKYGGLVMGDDLRLASAKERGEGQKYRASGLCFLKDVGATLDRMTDPNSIAGGMVGARMILENTFIRLGDPEDYLSAVLTR